jgi:hypothetical protein
MDMMGKKDIFQEIKSPQQTYFEAYFNDLSAYFW